MDLRGLANQAMQVINPDIIVTVQSSTGYTTGDGYKQIPTYATPVTGPAQIQALDTSNLRQIDGINMQSVYRVIYLRGVLAGVIRPNSQGGDLVTIASPASAELIGTWLVTKVLEAWPLWTKAVICMQEPS